MSSVSFSLVINVEALTTTDTAAINGPDNELRNVLNGNSNDILLFSGDGHDDTIDNAGNDLFDDGMGNDHLAGGAGADLLAAVPTTS